MNSLSEKYQKEAIDFVIRNASCGIFSEAVMERTAIVLTAIRELLYDRFESGKVLLVTSNISAKQVWSRVVKSWENLTMLRCSFVTGTEKQRIRAIKKRADIYMINTENLSWLLRQKILAFDTLVLDDLGKYKNEKSLCFQNALSLRIGAKRLIGVGTMPMEGKLEDLWAECYLLDGGVRLGRNKKGFLERYFFKDWKVINDNYCLRTEAKSGAREALVKTLGDLVYFMDSKRIVPHQKIQDIYLEMNPVEYSKYHWLENRLLKEKADAKDKYTFRRLMFLLRAANGMWKESDNGEYYHERKLTALDQYIKHNSDKTILIACCFVQDREEISKRYFNVLHVNSHDKVKQWNRKKYRIGVISPFSKEAGEGLEAGTDILIWYSLPWSYRAYERLNTGACGESRKSLIVRMIMLATIEERILLLLNRSSVDRQEMRECLLGKETEDEPRDII